MIFLRKPIERRKNFPRIIPSKNISFILRKYFSTSFIRIWIKRLFAKAWQNARKRRPYQKGISGLESGINVIGYFQTVKGISEAARSSILALHAANIPISVIDYELGIPEAQRKVPLSVNLDGHAFKFNTNLIHVNPPQLPTLWIKFGKEALTGKYTIGVWYWELPEFPDEWRFAFSLVDEVWAASQFVFDSISAKSPIPVVKIPPCINPVYDQRLARTDYNLPDERFLFMCAYDVLSVQERKNPTGAIDAFKRAFPKNASSVGLVIKVNNAKENPREIEQLHHDLDGYTNCYILEDVFDRLKFNSLLNVVDAYISLHRSEGFGLIPAEAMSLGKPVIMTRWSGNLDLMTSDNSCGVDYRLVKLDKQFGPYAPGQIWAEPNIEHAAFYMQKLHMDDQYYAKISESAKRYIYDYFSPQYVGQLKKDRLRKIGVLP